MSIGKQVSELSAVIKALTDQLEELKRNCTHANAVKTEYSDMKEHFYTFSCPDCKKTWTGER